MTPLVLPRQRFWHTRCRRVGVIHTITQPPPKPRIPSADRDDQRPVLDVDSAMSALRPLIPLSLLETSSAGK